MWQVFVSTERMGSKHSKQKVSSEIKKTTSPEHEESSPDETTSTKCKFFCWLLSSNRIESDSQLQRISIRRNLKFY